ncbi:MAG: SUMF1/EgtB/PvdO family nonheme iron enzyme [Planctomycetota bacterium]|jgi:formylglycine-generating enzyme required for sulfatase activity
MRVRAILVLVVAWVSVVCIGSAQAANPGDIYPDNKVDWLDMKVLADNWLFDGNTPADIDNSGDVNSVDYAILANSWGWFWSPPPDDMVLIPGGEFLMGDHHEGVPDERPIHTVLLDAFFMSKFEITNSQYCDYLNDANSLGLIEVRSGVVYASPGGTDRYCNTNISSSHSQIDYSGGVFSVRLKAGRDMSDDPMLFVSWYGSVAYCNWRSSEEGYESCCNLSTWECDFSKHGYRLPTEAEWEYAARGGLSGKRFPWADPNITHSLANYYSVPGTYPYDVSPTSAFHPDYNDVLPYTAPVGSFSANGYGLYDTAGNVFEWCHDWHDSDYYDTLPYDNPTGPASGTVRVNRGGSWENTPYYCRVGGRGSNSNPDTRNARLGFRVVLDF